MKQNRKMTTCNRLDFESLGSWPKNFPGSEQPCSLSRSHLVSLLSSHPSYINLVVAPSSFIAGPQVGSSVRHPRESFGPDPPGFLYLCFRYILWIPLTRLVILLNSWPVTGCSSNSTGWSITCGWFPPPCVRSHFKWICKSISNATR